MTYKTIEEVIQSQSVLKDGVDFFLNDPLQFIELVKRDHRLALAYAKYFRPEHLHAILSSTYGIFVHDKFFSLLMAIKPEEIHLQGAVTQAQMLEFIIQNHLIYLDTHAVDCRYQPIQSTKGHPLRYVFFCRDPQFLHPVLWSNDPVNLLSGPYEYGAGLEKQYRSFSQEEQTVQLLANIVATLLEKINRESALDGEFKDGVNTLFPTLMRQPSEPMSRIVASLLQHSTFDMARKQLLAPAPKPGAYLETIIKNYPTTKEAYDAVFQIFAQVAQRGQKSLRSYLKKFNTDILHLLANKEEELQAQQGPNVQLAEPFFNLGNGDGSEPNPMIELFPASGPRYIHAQITKSKPIDIHANNNNNNNNNQTGASLSSSAQSFFGSLTSFGRRSSGSSSSMLSNSFTNNNAQKQPLPSIPAEPPPPYSYSYPGDSDPQVLAHIVRDLQAQITELQNQNRLLSAGLDRVTHELESLQNQVYTTEKPQEQFF